MKVKTLLKTLRDVTYYITTESGRGLEEDFVNGDWGYTDGTSAYEDSTVSSITTVKDHDELYIRIK